MMFWTPSWGFTPAARDATSVELTDDEHQELALALRFGKQIVMGANGKPEAVAYPPVSLTLLQANYCADIDAQAEKQRLIYITPGAGQAMVYLQKQTQATAALAAVAAKPPMTAADGAAAFSLLAAEVGITDDPSTGKPAADVFGVARNVQALSAAWLPIAAAIEAARLKTKAAISAATTADAAQAARNAVAWPAPASA